jgi:hypothetical protein
MTKGYIQIEEGQWIEPTHQGFMHQCCNCALVHITDYAVVDRRTKKRVRGVAVQFKLKIDRRRTAASRRKLKRKK